MSRIPGRFPTAPPTLADVAELAGVSRQTVSNAVNNPDLLRADTLERVQEAIDELGYSPNRAARNLRTRASHLIGLRINPAQEGTANATMDRFVHSLVETSREAGYHVLLFAGEPRGPARRVRRPAALHRRRRVRRHRHLPRQPAGRLARGRAGRRSSRSAARGTTPTPGTRGSTSTGRPAPSWPPPTCSSAGHQRIAWIGWRKDSRIGEDRRAGWSRALRVARPAHDRAGLPGRGHRRQRPRGQRRAARRGPADRVRLRLRHPGHGRAAHAGRARAGARAATSPWSASTTPRSPRSCRPASPRCASRSRRSRSRSCKALEGLLGHPPVVGPGVLLTPRAGGARHELSRDSRAAGPAGCRTVRTVASRPEVDRVVDLGALVARPGPPRRRSRVELDADHALEVGARGERPADVAPASGSSRACDQNRSTATGSTVG